MADPKKETQALSLGDLIEALKALKGEDDDTLQKRAKYEAEAHARIAKRENDTHPGLSVFSYPEGDRAAAEAGKFKRLKCEMFWVGYPLDVDGLTPEEVDLLNSAYAGEFTFLKTDGTPVKLTVRGETSATGQPKKLEFIFPCQGENRHNLPTMTQVLRQAFKLKSAEQEELETLRALLAQKATVAA